MARGDTDLSDRPERVSPTTGSRIDPAWFERDVEAAGHVIFITDVTGRIVYVNPAFESVTGYDATEAVGRTPSLLSSGTHDEAYFCRLWETILAGEVWQEEIVNRRADGERYIATQTIAPIEDDTDGKITHFVAIQTDITERREHELALERSQDLSARTESAADVGCWELDLESEELRWTAGTRRIHGVDPSYEPSLEAALSFYHPSDREKVRSFVDRALEWGLPYDFEARLVTADGDTRVVRTTGQPIDSEAGTLLQGTIQDITERKSRHQQLMVFNRVHRHNLRNGLNVVLGHAEGVFQALDSEDPSPEALEQIRADARHIISAAEDLHDISERAREFDSLYQQIGDVEPVESRRLLAAVASEYRDAYPAATITVEGPNPVVLVNRHALRVAIAELVDNALEHTAETGPRVTLAGRTDPAGTLRFAVADCGDGIPAMERVVITDGEERPLKHGIGLGLWIVKWLVTAIRGSIDIADNDPCGTIVSVVFPAARWQATAD